VNTSVATRLVAVTPARAAVGPTTVTSAATTSGPALNASSCCRAAPAYGTAAQRCQDRGTDAVPSTTGPASENGAGG
jgi:hypothetical protein